MACVPSSSQRTLQKNGDRREVSSPDGDVDVVVRARDGAEVKIDSPPTEQPVGDPPSLEQVMNSGQRGELLDFAHREHFVAIADDWPE